MSAMLPHMLRVCSSILILLLLLPTSAIAQDHNSGMCPLTPALGDRPSRQLWLRGDIGGRAARMYLQQGGTTIIGVYYYTADTPWIPVILGGRLAGNALQASDKDDEAPATGELTGKIIRTGFVGAWTPSGGDHPLSAHLRFEPAPSCKGSGPWKRLDDPTLPITFSYPASWQLSRRKDGITLTCPDPAKMAYDNGVQIWTGGLKDIGRQGFHFKDGKWKYDHAAVCDADNDEPHGCADAPVAHQGPFTMLNGDRSEWRMYCARGGYVGQADGNARVLILGERWVEFSGMASDAEMSLRILATARPRTAQTSSPVLPRQ